MRAPHLIEKLPKTIFFIDKNLEQDIILTHFLRNRSRIKKYLYCSPF